MIGDPPAPVASRASAGARQLSPDTWAIVAIAAVVLAANLPYVLGFFDPNPLDFRAGLTSAVTHGLLAGKPTIDPSNGFTSQAIGHLAVRDLLHLHLPWWNPYEGTGMPLLGEAQSAALYPPTLLTALANGQLYEHMLFEFVAGVCTLRLLRRVGLGRAAALAGAIAFALNGKFAWFSDATVNALPCLPMLLLGLERAYAATREGRPGGWRLIALAGALSVYAGFPEVAYVDALMAVAWAAWRCGCLERGQIARFAARIGLGALAGALLAAPVLVAMANNFGQADLGLHSGSQYGSIHLSAAALPQLLLPYVYGPVNGDPLAGTWIRVGGYISTVLVVLALLALLAPGRRGLKLVLLGWGLLVFARMYGEPPLLGHVLGLAPGMGRVQYYRYATATLELPVIVLAALGIDDLAGAGAGRGRLLAAAGVAALLVLAAEVGGHSAIHALSPGHDHGTYLAVSIAWGAFGVLALAACAWWRDARVLAVLVALDALVLFVVPEFSAPRATRTSRAAVAYLQAHLGEQRFFTLAPIAPDYGSYFSLASLGVDDFPPKRYTGYYRSRLDPAAAFIGFRSSTAPSTGWELIHHLASYRAASVAYVLARPNDRQLSHAPGLVLASRSVTAVIYRITGADPYFSAAGCTLVSADRDGASVDCARASTLVRRETWFPGWSAQVDGRSAPIGHAGSLFQDVALPAGRHEVTFAFAPPRMAWAGWGLLGGILLLGVPTLRGRGRGRGRAPRGRRGRSRGATAYDQTA